MALSIFLLITFIVVGNLYLYERIKHADTKRESVLRLARIHELEQRVNNLLPNPSDSSQLRYFINALAQVVHDANAKWWNDLETGEPLPLDANTLLTKLILVHSEISEAVEGYRKGKMDDHLTDTKMLDAELIDALIRLLDLLAVFVNNPGDVFVRKMSYNSTRLDHTTKYRQQVGGKKF